MNPVPQVVDHAKRSVIETIKSKSPFSVLNIAAILAILIIGYFLYKKFNKKFNRDGSKMPKRPVQMPRQMPQQMPMPMMPQMPMPQQMPQPQQPVKKVSFKKPIVKAPEPEPIVEDEDDEEEDEDDVPDVEVTEE